MLDFINMELGVRLHIFKNSYFLRFKLKILEKLVWRRRAPLCAVFSADEETAHFPLTKPFLVLLFANRVLIWLLTEAGNAGQGELVDGTPPTFPVHPWGRVGGMRPGNLGSHSGCSLPRSGIQAEPGKGNLRTRRATSPCSATLQTRETLGDSLPEPPTWSWNSPEANPATCPCSWQSEALVLQESCEALWPAPPAWPLRA